MHWFSQLSDAVSQALADAPLGLQMAFLLVTAVPIAVVGAWVLMWLIDFCARTLANRPPGPQGVRPLREKRRG